MGQAKARGHVLASPHEPQAPAVRLSAWDAPLVLDDPVGPSVPQFINRGAPGPGTPEQGLTRPAGSQGTGCTAGWG